MDFVSSPFLLHVNYTFALSECCLQIWLCLLLCCGDSSWNSTSVCNARNKNKKESCRKDWYAHTTEANSHSRVSLLKRGVHLTSDNQANLGQLRSEDCCWEPFTFQRTFGWMLVWANFDADFFVSFSCTLLAIFSCFLVPNFRVKTRLSEALVVIKGWCAPFWVTKGTFRQSSSQPRQLVSIRVSARHLCTYVMACLDIDQNVICQECVQFVWVFSFCALTPVVKHRPTRYNWNAMFLWLATESLWFGNFPALYPFCLKSTTWGEPQKTVQLGLTKGDVKKFGLSNRVNALCLREQRISHGWSFVWTVQHGKLNDIGQGDI